MWDQGAFRSMSEKPASQIPTPEGFVLEGHDKKMRNMSIASGASHEGTMVSMSSSASSPDRNFTLALSKMEEKTAEYERQCMKGTTDLELDVKSLNENLKLLNAKASDVKDQTKSSMGPGGMKRKREVEEWLAQVKSIESEYFELETRAESDAFIKYLVDGGKVAELNERVVTLVKQSQHFDEFWDGPFQQGVVG